MVESLSDGDTNHKLIKPDKENATRGAARTGLIHSSVEAVKKSR